MKIVIFGYNEHGKLLYGLLRRDGYDVILARNDVVLQNSVTFVLRANKPDLVIHARDEVGEETYAGWRQITLGTAILHDICKGMGINLVSLSTFNKDTPSLKSILDKFHSEKCRPQPAGD